MLLEFKGAYFHYGPKKLSTASRSQSVGAIQFSHIPVTTVTKLTSCMKKIGEKVF